MSSDKKELYVWVDVETTGLNPATCSVIEVAFVITEGPETGFKEVAGARGSVFVDPGHAIDEPTKEQKRAFEMHKESGLWAAWCRASDAGYTYETHQADNWLCEFLAEVWLDYPAARLYLAARNPQFDRRFIESDFPRFAKELHYRNFDVSALCLVDPSLYDYEHGVEGEPHRAMYDILRDLEYAREFVRRFRS